MILLKMFFIQVLCPVLLIAGVHTLTIDSQLGTSIEDCFDRISIGEQLPSTAIYRNVSELTIRECEQICKQDKQCQAYDYGVGAKGNATCNLSTADEKQVKEKSLLSRHPDYDVYVRRFDCEQAPPTPIHGLQDEGQNEGDGHTGHRPVFRPAEERPLSDYVVSGDISYRPDDLSNLGPDIGNGPGYGDHRPQDVAFRPPNGPFRPGDYRPGFNDPHRPMGDPFRPLPNEPYRPNDAPNRPNRPRPNDKFRPENPQGPYRPNKPKPDINDELEFQGPPQINNRPENSPEKPNYHYIVRPNRRPHYDDHQKPTYDPSVPIGPPNIPYRPNRPHERPPYDYNQQYASNYGQNDVQVQIYDPPRPYVPIKDRPNHPNYGQGFLGYGTYSDQSNSYTGTITEIEKPYGQWPMYADYGPQRPNYRPVANQGTKGSYGSVSQDGYGSNNGYGSNSNSYFGSSSGYDSKPSYNSRPGNKPSFVRPSYGFPQSCGNTCLDDGNQSGDNTGYGNGLEEPGYENRPGYATNQSYGTNSQSYGNGNQGYNKPQNNYNIDSSSYNKPDKNPSYNFQSSYGNQKPDNQGYGQQKPSKPNNYYQGDQNYGNGNSQNGYASQNYGGYGQSYETYGQSYGYDTQSSYGSKGSYGNYDLQGGYNRPSYNDHKKPSYETSYGNQNPSNYPKPNYEDYGFHKPIPTYDNEKPTYGDTKPGYGIEKPGYETPSYGKPSSTNEKPGYNTPSYPKPGYSTEKPSYDTPTYGKPDYSVEKPGYNENSGYGKPDNQSYDPDRPDVKPVYEYEMDKPGDVPSYIARPGGEVVTSRPVVVGDYGERHDYGEQRKSNKACFRRVLAGKRALRSFVRKVINCETLEDCRYECAMEKRFHCESFNYRFDTSFRRKGLCELMTKPIEAFDIRRDFAEDKNSDFYEIDRNSLEPNCPETLGGPGMLHSGFLSSKPGKAGWQDRFWDRSGDRVWDRSGDRGWQRGWDRERTWDRIDGMYSNDGGRGGNKRVENFTPYLIGLGRTEKPENWGQYGGNYGGNQEYYKDRNDYHKSYSYWGLTSEKPSYGVKPFTQYDFYKGFNYHTLGKHEFQHPSDFNHPTDKYDQDGGKYDHPTRKYDHAGGKYDHSSSGKFDHRPEYEYGTTATYHPTGKSLIDYHPPGTTSAEYHPPGKSVIYNPPGKTIIDYHPTGKDFDHTSGDFDHHSSLSGDFDHNHHSTLGGDFDHNHHGTLGGDFDHNHHSTLGGDFDHNHHSTLSGDSDHTVSDFDHSKGDYGSWKNRQWNASGGPIEREDKSGLDLLDGNEVGVENECISHRNPGMALSSGAIRRSLHAHSVIECETECFTERQFKCVSYSFRYSTSSNTDNCFLSERPYRGVDLSADSGSDVYAMPQDANCVRHIPWIESECFWHVRSGWAVRAGGAALAVRGLGACEAECVRAHGFFCRGFSYRFEPSPKEPDFNCILTSSPPTSLSADSLVASAGHELYARGNYGRGCEPHAYEHPREIGECYLQYEKSAMLSAASQRGHARVRDQQACAAACTHAPFQCFSFSYKNASLSTDDNCFLSDIRLFDLKRGVDFVHSDDDLLFSFDVFDSKCLKELSFDKPVSELPRPIQPFPGGPSGPEHPDDHEPGKGPFKPGVTISVPSSGPGFEPTFPVSGPTGSDFTTGPDYRPSRPSRPEKPFTPSKENRPFSTYGPGPEDSNPVDHRPANGDLPYAVPIKPPQKPIYRPNSWSRPKDPTYGPKEPTYGPERPTYGQERPNYGPERPTYGPERPNYGPERPTYGPERPTYGQERPNHGPERPFKPDFRPKPQIPGYGESPVGSGYLPDQRPQRPQYGADRENANPMGTWRHYTVSGLPCRGGTVCQQNRVAGHWACEPEGGEVGSWDYCCAPTHRCGYSEGFNKPWCFVGHKEDQWRPCSDKYYPYHQHGRPHPTQGNTGPAAPHARPWRESPARAPSPPAADRHYWDDLYNNGPSAYYDNNGNPLPGYSRVPDFKEDRRDGPWLAIPQEERPGLGVPRYWPVAYLHKSPPPNITYFRYNEDKENKTKVTPKDTPESRNIEIALDTADEVKPNNISYKENRKNTSNIEPYATIDKDDNNDRKNTSNIFEIAKKVDESKNVQTTTTTTEISLDLTNDTELIDETEEIKNLDKIEGIDDKLSDFTKSIEVFDLEDANKSEFKTLEAEEKQIEAIGRLVASRRGSKIMLEKRSQKEIEARNIAVDDKTVFNGEIAELNRRTGKYNKQADFDNEPTFDSERANFNNEKQASNSPKPKLDFERPNYSNEKSNSNEKQSFDNEKLNFQTTKVPVEDKTEPEFNFGNKFPTERRGVIKKISKDEIERDRNTDKSLEVSETIFVRPPRVLSTTENIRKALFNGKIFYDATIRDSRDLTNNTRKGKRIDFTPKRLENTTKSINFTNKRFDNVTKKLDTTKRLPSTTQKIDFTTKRLQSTTQKIDFTTKRLQSTTQKIEFTTKRLESTTPSVISNSTYYGRKKNIRTRTTDPVRRVKRVYKKRYNPGEVRRRLLDRERNSTKSDNDK